LWPANVRAGASWPADAFVPAPGDLPSDTPPGACLTGLFFSGIAALEAPLPAPLSGPTCIPCSGRSGACSEGATELLPFGCTFSLPGGLAGPLLRTGASGRFWGPVLSLPRGCSGAAFGTGRSWTGRGRCARSTFSGRGCWRAGSGPTGLRGPGSRPDFCKPGGSGADFPLCTGLCLCTGFSGGRTCCLPGGSAR
jgi:hypothetical protein